jgi:hypothetical protein
MKPSKEFPLSLFQANGHTVKPGLTFLFCDTGNAPATEYRVLRVNPFTHMAECEAVTNYAQNPDAQGGTWQTYTPPCQHTQRVETGFGTAYCKTCPAKFKFVNFNWVLT